MAARKTKPARIKSALPLNGDLENLGMNLRKLRVQHKMTQVQLAKAVKLNIRTLQRVEAGQTNILVTTVIRFMQALDCVPNDLLLPHAPTEPESAGLNHVI